MAWQSAPLIADPASTLRRRVEFSAEIDALADVADEIGPEGRAYLFELLRARLGMPDRKARALLESAA
jgi:hypothetical protein